MHSEAIPSIPTSLSLRASAVVRSTSVPVHIIDTHAATFLSLLSHQQRTPPAVTSEIISMADLASVPKGKDNDDSDETPTFRFWPKLDLHMKDMVAKFCAEDSVETAKNLVLADKVGAVPIDFYAVWRSGCSAADLTAGPPEIPARETLDLLPRSMDQQLAVPDNAFGGHCGLFCDVKLQRRFAEHRPAE